MIDREELVLHADHEEEDEIKEWFIAELRRRRERAYRFGVQIDRAHDRFDKAEKDAKDFEATPTAKMKDMWVESKSLTTSLVNCADTVDTYAGLEMGRSL